MVSSDGFNGSDSSFLGCYGYVVLIDLGREYGPGCLCTNGGAVLGVISRLASACHIIF